MEIEDFEEDEEYLLKNEIPISENKNNLLNDDKNIQIKSKKSFRFESKSQDNSYVQQEDTEQEHNLTEDEKNYVEMSPGKRFGRFDEEIGVGNNKIVYRGFDFNQGREVAWNVVKTLNDENSEFSEITKEVQVMKQLHHPNIINYISCWFNKSKKEFVIITEIVCGGSLRKHLTKLQNPRLRLIKHWIKEILKGLKYLHIEVNPPIIHRDIKCENIFVDTNNGTIKIGDLGLSTTYKETEGYMAPEVIEGKYSVLADIYSLGMCILEIASLEKPYKEYEDNIMLIYECKKTGVMPKCLDKIKNIKLKKFILDCLKPESERPSAEELLSDNFLNEIESEENNRPIEIIENNSETIKEANCNFLIEQMIENYIEINKLKRFHKGYTLDGKSEEDYFIRNESEESNFYKNTRKRNSSNNYKHKNLYINQNNTRSVEQLNDLKGQRGTSPIKFTKDYYIKKNIFKIDEEMLKIKTMDIKNKIIALKPTSSRTVSHFDNHNQHKVSLKNSLNKNNTYSKFEINISESKEDKIKNCNLNKMTNCTYKEKREIQINFLVHKEEWINKKQIITFNYDLFNDTIEGVVQELQKAIGLSEEEFHVVNKKLTEFIKGYKTSQNIESTEPRINIEGTCVSTASDQENNKKFKNDLDNFYISFNKLIRKIENLIQHENTLKLEDFRNKYLNSFNSFRDPDINKILDEYTKKYDLIKNILKISEDNTKPN